MPITKPNETARTEQQTLNNSTDEEFQVLAVEGLVYNPVTGQLDRLVQPLTSTSIIPLPTGAATSAKQDTQTTLLQGIAGFAVTGYDYIGATYPDTSTEVYTYKTSGSGGTTIATITVVYSDAVTKNIITSVTKT